MSCVKMMRKPQLPPAQRLCQRERSAGPRLVTAKQVVHCQQGVVRMRCQQ